MTYEIIHSPNIPALKEVADNTYDSIVTDPPYGLGKEPDIVKVMQAWLDHGYYEVKHKAGFMGKEWDKFVPQPIFWKQAIRVLKPGGYAVVACGTRTMDWMMMAMRFAGFEIKDVITWHYGSGFPKSMDISKAIDKAAGAEREVIGKKPGTYADIKRDSQTGQDGLHGGIAKDRERVESLITKPSTDEAKQYDGFGTALKPATEFFILARKPLSENTIVANILKWGTGGLNIDGSRISTQEDLQGGSGGLLSHQRNDKDYPGENGYQQNKAGRWPANVIFSHHPDCTCIGTKKVTGTFTGNGDAAIGEHSKGSVALMRRGTGTDRTDENGLETVENWSCVDGCPVKELDAQSGILVSGEMNKTYKYCDNGFAMNPGRNKDKKYFTNGSKGGASRFFYCAKASKSERNAGLNEGEINDHPTVKPVSIMQYLVKLVTPPGGHCLDPFVGSGTTICATVLEGFSGTGIEQEEKNCIISRKRIQFYKKQQPTCKQLTL